MKKFTSIFGLIAKGSLFKVLPVIIATVSAEIILFYLEMKKAIDIYNSDVGFSLERLENVFDGSKFSWCLVLGFISITLLLIRHGCESNTKSIYTFQRLSVSEKFIFFNQAAYNSLVYIIFLASQAITAALLCLWYANVAPKEFVGNQTVFLAFYRNNLLHNLLPLSDVSIWIRNSILAIGLGFGAAEFPFKQRRKKFAAVIFSLGLYIIIFAVQDFGNDINTFFMILVSIACILETIYTVMTAEKEEVIYGEK